MQLHAEFALSHQFLEVAFFLQIFLLHFTYFRKSVVHFSRTFVLAVLKKMCQMQCHSIYYMKWVCVCVCYIFKRCQI